MDKIVDHLFVFKGDGVIEDFPGNYTDYKVYEDSKPAEENTAVKNTDSRIKSDNKSKLSFKEKKEFDNIEGDIEALTTQKSAIEAKFLDAALSVEEINELSAKLQEINQKIDQKEGRWFELSSMLE
jgi:ATP-binding cassette subfamily F protein uup